LKRIPVDVIHSLMADLHLRIRKTDNQITVITANGREWKAYCVLCPVLSFDIARIYSYT